MNKLFQLERKKYDIIVYAACMGIVGVLLVNQIFWWSWPMGIAAVSVLVWTLLLFWSLEGGTRLWLWGGIAAAAVILFFYLYRSGYDMARCLFWAELEAASLIAAFAAWLAGKYFWLRVPVIAAETAAMVYCGAEEISLPKWAICMGLFCILMLLAEWTEHHTQRKGGLNPLRLTPVFVCMVLVIGFLPSKEIPMKWDAVTGFLDSAAKNIHAAVIEIGYLLSEHSEIYSLPFSGYDEDGTLSGSLFANDFPQISVKGEKMKSPLYLTGSIYDTYTGNGWILQETGGGEYMQQYGMLKKAMDASIYTEDEIWELTRYRGYQVKYEGIRTESLFLAPATDKIVLPGAEKTHGTDGGNYKLVKSQGVGFTYQMYFLEVDYGNEKIGQLLRQEAWKDYPVPDDGERTMQEYAYECNTKLPDSVPERVYALADEITAGMDNDYDRLLAIEAYLNRYTYTTDVKQCPKGADAVDYFLFESKSGYCTYFAAAMAVLGRCEGIPMRYVEGFVTDEVCQENGEPVLLSGEDAHAWAEGYIEHVGWVPFEATPGYAGLAGEQWEPPHGAADFKDAAVSDIGKPEIEGMDATEGAAPEEDGTDTFAMLGKAAVLFLRLVLILLLLTAFFAGLLSIKLWIGKKRYLTKTETEKLKELMKKVLLFGTLYGTGLEQGETLHAYGIRCGSCLDTETESFEAFCRLYEEIRFGGKTAEPEAVRSAEQYVKALETEYLKNHSRAKRIVYWMK